MSIEEFVADFAEQLEDIDVSDIISTTCFKELAAWDSLTVLSVISMIKLNYGVDLSGLDVNNCNTIADVYSLVEKTRG